MAMSLWAQPGTAQENRRDYPLPRVLTFIIGEPTGTTKFGEAFTGIGDLNGDGYDDLMVNHDPSYDTTKANRIELFYGGIEMGNQPDVIMTATVPQMGIGGYIHYLGTILPQRKPLLLIRTGFQIKKNSIFEVHYWFMERDSFPNGLPTYMLHGRTDARYQSPPIPCHHSCPFDFNGDGSPDLLMVEPTYDGGPKETNWARVMVYYGGACFDTLPDWETAIPTPHSTSIVAAVGGDLNADGYDDIVLRQTISSSDAIFRLILGGVAADTTPAWVITPEDFPKKQLNRGQFAILPDINGDGYDEWGMYYCTDTGAFDGVLVFLGKDVPTKVPEINLPGFSSISGTKGDLCGGDFNGDGYGDIVVGNPTSQWYAGEIKMFFGHPGFEPKPTTDIAFIGEGQMGSVEWQVMGYKVGAVADYNGDGVDDFAALGNHNLAVFAGSRDWEVNVPVEETVPQSYELSLKTYPNPFNSSIKIEFGGDKERSVVEVYSVDGRRVCQLFDGYPDVGVNRMEWTAPVQLGAGVYLIVFTQIDSQRRKVGKVVYLP